MFHKILGKYLKWSPFYILLVKTKCTLFFFSRFFLKKVPKYSQPNQSIVSSKLSFSGFSHAQSKNEEKVHHIEKQLQQVFCSDKETHAKMLISCCNQGQFAGK